MRILISLLTILLTVLLIPCISAYSSNFQVYVNDENNQCAYMNDDSIPWLFSKNTSWYLIESNLSSTWKQNYRNIPLAVRPFCEEQGYKFHDSSVDYLVRDEMVEEFKAKAALLDSNDILGRINACFDRSNRLGGHVWEWCIIYLAVEHEDFSICYHENTIYNLSDSLHFDIGNCIGLYMYKTKNYFICNDVDERYQEICKSERNNALIEYIGIGFFFFMIFVSISMLIAIYFYFAMALYTISKKLDTGDSWMAFIPTLNLYLLIELSSLPKFLFWIMLFASFFGIYGLFCNCIIISIVWGFIAQERNKPVWYGILMIIPIVNLFIIREIAWKDEDNF